MQFKETKSKKACGGCPFKRINSNEKPNPGGSHPFVYIGQTLGPFWLPCHKDKNYVGAGSNPTLVTQCRGAAIFRSNCGVSEKMPDKLIKLEKDTEDVFASPAEFVSHYSGHPIDVVEAYLSEENLRSIMIKEFTRSSKTKRYYK